MGLCALRILGACPKHQATQCCPLPLPPPNSLGSYEHKPAEVIQKDLGTDYLSRINSTLTTVRGVNRTDVKTLGDRWAPFWCRSTALRAAGRAGARRVLLDCARCCWEGRGMPVCRPTALRAAGRAARPGWAVAI